MVNDTDFIIRQAQIADLQAVADAHRASIKEIGSQFYRANLVKIWGRETPIERYQKAIEVDGEIYFLAERTDRPNYALGFSSYHFYDGKHHVAACYVRGTEARKGVGLQLIKAVENIALSKGATEIYIEASLSAESFYKHCGYLETQRVVRPMTDGIKSVDMDAIHMVKKF